MLRLIRTTAAVVITVLLAVTVLLAQGNFATVQQSAEGGDADAQSNLGRMYAAGLGVPQDHAEAVRWFRLAAEQGDVNAQATLGRMYAEGRGVLKDSVLAHMWLNIAGANGSEMAGEERANLERDMTRAEITRATELARECMASDYQIQICEP